MPPLLRLWVDEVVDSRWMNETEPNPFEGKDVHFLITTRNKESTFGRESRTHYTIEELISSLIATMKLFRANVHEPYVVYESENLNRKEIVLHKQRFAEILNQSQ